MITAPEGPARDFWKMGWPEVETSFALGGLAQNVSDAGVHLGIFDAGGPMKLSPRSKGMGVTTLYVPAARQNVVPGGCALATAARLDSAGTSRPSQVFGTGPAMADDLRTGSRAISSVPSNPEPMLMKAPTAMAPTSQPCHESEGSACGGWSRARVTQPLWGTCHDHDRAAEAVKASSAGFTPTEEIDI
jgi:hypothetical protein